MTLKWTKITKNYAKMGKTVQEWEEMDKTMYNIDKKWLKIDKK